MLNHIWASMMLIGICYGVVNGSIADVGNGLFASAKEAVLLCISMSGTVAFWSGLMEIALASGLIEHWKKALTPFLKWLFPRLDVSSEASGYIATNIIANILGLGWACTPSGLKAMEALADIERKRLGTDILSDASEEMCTFLILNVSSLQLIPVNMIAYRTQYGSVNPSAILLPAILATTFSTLAGVLFAKVSAIFYRNKQ